MGLDGGRSIGMPKSLSERSSKSEFSDSEFVFGGGLNLMVVLTWEREAERGMGILGEAVIWGVWGEMVIWGWRGGSGGLVERGIWGRWDLGGEDCDVEGHGEGDLGVAILAYFPKQGEFWERVEGELVLQGNPHIVVCPCFSLDL